MFVLVGFAVGYAVGAKQGQEGFDRLMASIKHIKNSDEFAAGIETARSLAGSMLQQAIAMAGGVVAGEVKNAGRRLRAA
jgi:hypothetical protein